MSRLTEDYTDYMNSKAWNKKRRARLKKDNYTCQGCGEKNKPLDVHHKTYERFGHERLSDLESLCRRCHDQKHGKGFSIAHEFCQTCGELLMTFVQRVKVLGVWWTDRTCEHGHMRSRRDE